MLFIFGIWAGFIFIAATDCEVEYSLSARLIKFKDAVVMILHVWALWCWLKSILGVLLMLYTTEVVAYLVFCVRLTIDKGTTGMQYIVSYHVHYITEYPLFSLV